MSEGNSSTKTQLLLSFFKLHGKLHLQHAACLFWQRSVLIIHPSIFDHHLSYTQGYWGGRSLFPTLYCNILIANSAYSWFQSLQDHCKRTLRSSCITQIVILKCCLPSSNRKRFQSVLGFCDKQASFWVVTNEKQQLQVVLMWPRWRRNTGRDCHLA